jgi:hypothetical protein
MLNAHCFLVSDKIPVGRSIPLTRPWQEYEDIKILLSAGYFWQTEVPGWLKNEI